MSRFGLVLGQGISRPPTPKVSGMLEVISPEDGFVLEKCVPLSRCSGLGRTDSMKEQKNWQNGRLHVIDPKGSIGCGKESTSRPCTPSKRILLYTAKSLDKQNTLTRDSNGQNPKTTVRLHKSIQEEAGEKEETFKNVEKAPNSEVRTEAQESSVDKQDAEEKPSDSSDDDECSGEQNDGEAEKRTAPLELMGEFLKAIMERDYSLAKKLCQMILIYEPQNPEAEQFLPLIERKLQLESVQEADGEETDEGSTDDSEEDTSDTDDSGTESEASSEDSDT